MSGCIYEFVDTTLAMSYRSAVRESDFESVYSTKSDDELLLLAADPGALRPDARTAFAGEISRRELTDSELKKRESKRSVYLDKAEWIGLWLLNTLIATFGTLINVGIFKYSTTGFVSRTLWIRLVLTPYYPLPVVIALCIGFFSYLRFWGSYRYWVWVLPSLLTISAMSHWQSENQASLSSTLIHFLGRVPYPENRDQLDSTVFIYLTLAYSLGALIHSVLDAREAIPDWFPRTRAFRTRLSE